MTNRKLILPNDTFNCPICGREWTSEAVMDTADQPPYPAWSEVIRDFVDRGCPAFKAEHLPAAQGVN